MAAFLSALLTAPWRVWPALALVALGVAVAARGLYRERRDLRRPPTDPGLGFALARALRSTLGGLAIAGMGLGWYWSLASLLVVSALIGLEEMLEITSVLRALRADTHGRHGG
jgi:hypothetical protein